MKKIPYINSNFVAILPIYKHIDLFPNYYGLENLSEVGPKEEYDSFSISAYDHWLTEEEFETTMVTFDSFGGRVPSRQTDLWTYYKALEDKFLNFYNRIFYESSYISIDNKNKILKLNKNEYLKYCYAGIREKPNYKCFNFLLPFYGVIISPGFNLTHIVHASKKYYKNDEFEKIVKDSGLYILR